MKLFPDSLFVWIYRGILDLFHFFFSIFVLNNYLLFFVSLLFIFGRALHEQYSEKINYSKLHKNADLFNQIINPIYANN